MTLDVIICTKDRLEDLSKFLPSLNSQDLPPTRLIIVDSSETPLIDRIKPLVSPNISMEYVRSQPGLTHQRNVGLERATSDVVMFFDDDVILDSGYIKAVMKEYAKKPYLGGVSGKITNAKLPQRYYQPIAYITQQPYNSLHGKSRLSGYRTDTFHLNKSIEGVEFMSGCCMSFNRKLLIKAGRFDEKLERYCVMEDLDASYRVSRLAPLVFLPEAKLIHNESPKNRLKINELHEMSFRNHIYLFKKNMPQTVINKTAHLWSIYYQIVAAFIRGDKGKIDAYFRAKRRPISLD